jgi:hypothetical protein
MVAGSGSLSAQGHAAPALLPRADVCTLIVPAQALAWHRADLPKLPRGISTLKMQAVLAGALEEQLLDEPAALHLALVNLAGSDAPWVAVCNKAWLSQSIATLQQAGVQPSSIVPQAWPQQEAQAHVTGHTVDSAQMILSNAQGVLCWPLAHAAALGLDAEMPLTAEPAVAAAAEQALQRRAQVLQVSQAAIQSAAQAKAWRRVSSRCQAQGAHCKASLRACAILLLHRIGAQHAGAWPFYCWPMCSGSTFGLGNRRIRYERSATRCSRFLPTPSRM